MTKPLDIYRNYCLHQKLLIIGINSILSPNKIREIYKKLVDKEINHNEDQLLIYGTIDFDN